jgi:nitrite reductase (cytochrome c-552)
MGNAEDALVAAIAAIKAAAAVSGVDSAKLDEARQMHRDAQMMWDFVAAENSMGFHNPTEALRILANAANLARQAQLKAVEAAGTPDILQGSN